MPEQPYGVLIVHGFTASLDCVSGIEAALKDSGLPIRMPVLRGHGAESPEALRGVFWHDWVADAEAALKDLLTEVDKVIVVGHSMGGLVSRLQTIESRDDFWKLVSDQPFSLVKADPEARTRLEKSLFFHPNTSVRRVVTIGTPHRGSEMSNNLTQWLSNKLIRLPDMLDLTKDDVIKENKELYERISPYLSPHGDDGKINLNTAHPLVLRALSDETTEDPEMVEDMDEYRWDEDKDLKSINWDDRVGMRGVNHDPALLTTSSTYFEIVSEGQKRVEDKEGKMEWLTVKRVTAMVQRKEGEFDILSWKIE